MNGAALFATVLCLAATAAWANHRFVRAPATVALMTMALAAAIALLLVERYTRLPASKVTDVVASLNFHEILLDGMLPFLLFAGALHVDFKTLRDERAPVLWLATAGTILATLFTGGLVWLAAKGLGIKVTFLQTLLFGALIAPTDPIAVLAILRTAGASKALEAVMAGESLLNDGVGVVLFVALAVSATRGASPDLSDITGAFVLEAAGGVLLGVIIGWIVCRMLAAVDDFPVEIFVTLATAAGTYALANAVHVSGALAVVAAGLWIASYGRKYGMSSATQRELDPFWKVLDEILNAILFMLIGLEAIVVPFDLSYAGFAMAAVGAVLVARWGSVGLVLAAMGGKRRFPRGTLASLTWGGVRGGISIALVLSLPDGDTRDLLLMATYAVVVFSVLIQGTTLAKVVRASGAATGP